jgi:hypothetical protein
MKRIKVNSTIINVFLLLEVRSFRLVNDGPRWDSKLSPSFWHFDLFGVFVDSSNFAG